MKKESPQDPLSRSRLRALQYQHIDGTFELEFGGTFLLMAISFFVVSRIPASDSFVVTNLLPWIPLLVFVGGAYLIDVIVQRVRLRVTYPRTGFMTPAKPKPIKRSTRLAILIGVPVLTLFILFLLFINRSRFQNNSPDDGSIVLLLFSGLLFSGLWLIIGWKSSLPRFYLIAVVTILASAWLLLKGFEVNLGFAALIGVTGIALLISGSFTLLHYLHQFPAPSETPDEQ